MAKYNIVLYLFLGLVYMIICRELTPEQIEKLESFTEAVTACRHNVGLTMALVREGETIYTNALGYRDNDNQLPMTNLTRTAIWSLTKSFTAILFSRLVEQGLVKWDTPIQDVLGPEFELEDEFRTQATLRDCFGHRIGMANYWGLAKSAVNVTREELCMRRLRYFQSRVEFRDKNAYANYPLVLVGYVIEVLTGKTWEEQVAEYIFEPLGMSNTIITADMTEDDWEISAYSHLYVDGEFVRNPDPDQLIFLTEMGPSVGIFSTANDMAKYMKFILSEGQNEAGEQIVPPSVIQNLGDDIQYRPGTSQLSKPQYPVDEVDQSYCNGVFNGMYRGYEKLHHSGSGSAYNCRLSMLVEADVGVTTCCNSPGRTMGANSVHVINMFALDLLLDEDPWLNETTGCTFPDPWSSYTESEGLSPDIHPIHIPSVSHSARRPLVEYEGVYVDPGLDIFTVYINDTTDTLYYRHGRLLNGELLPAEEGDEFRMMLHHPLTYEHWLNEQYRDGYPLSFGVSEDDIVVSVTVAYLDTNVWPTFQKT